MAKGTDKKKPVKITGNFGTRDAGGGTIKKK